MPQQTATDSRREEVQGLLRRVKALFGVELLGVDVVIEPSSGRLLVVDVNHFSGAPKSVPGFEAALKRLVAGRRANG